LKINKKLLLSNGYQLGNTDVYMMLEDFKQIKITTNIKIVESELEFRNFICFSIDFRTLV